MQIYNQKHFFLKYGFIVKLFSECNMHLFIGSQTTVLKNLSSNMALLISIVDTIIFEIMMYIYIAHLHFYFSNIFGDSQIVWYDEIQGTENIETYQCCMCDVATYRICHTTPHVVLDAQLPHTLNINRTLSQITHFHKLTLKLHYFDTITPNKLKFTNQSLDEHFQYIRYQY